MTSLKLAVTDRSPSRHQAVVMVIVPSAATIKVAHCPHHVAAINVTLKANRVAVTKRAPAKRVGRLHLLRQIFRSPSLRPKNLLTIPSKARELMVQ